MEVNQVLVTNDNSHKVIVTKILSNDSFVIECASKNISFTRLMTTDELIMYGIPLYSWEKYFVNSYRKN